MCLRHLLLQPCVPVADPLPIQADASRSASRFRVKRRQWLPYSAHSPRSASWQLDWDPFENLYGLGMNMSSREHSLESKNHRSWYGPEGQYVRELPCPTCRGRGCLKCSSCSIIRRESNCLQCSGKGFKTCPQCLGERVVWEESVNETAWERAHSRSPLKVADDDFIESMDIPPVPKRKASRVYRPTAPEVREKISRSLKELERRTGSISRRVRKLHQDPVLHAQRKAAIKRAKSTEHSRKNISEKQRLFFQDPKNRAARSQAMKGVPFFCKLCGEEGHRRHFCPDSGFIRKGPKNVTRRNRCSNCAQVGHQKRNCPNKSEDSISLSRAKGKAKSNSKLCSFCQQPGHNRRTCPTSMLKTGSNL